jgi:phage shock protein PspC (stress-responsive transcriptional regulator)
MNRPNKILYRSRSNRLIGGVAAGIGDYLGLDPTVVRLLFIFAALIGWVAPAVIVYLIMLFVVPEEPLATGTSSAPVPARPASAAETTLSESMTGPSQAAAVGAVIYEPPARETEPKPGDSGVSNDGGAGI